MHERPSRTSSDALVGALVGRRFELEARLGTGSVGVVYRARDQQTGDAVAIKVWHGVDDEQSRGRFAREAQALATLEHANIVDVLSTGRLETGTPYVAMELLRGETLEATLAADGAMNPERVRHIMRQLLSAIAFAHKRNVVHRDLKPDNIFLCRDGSGQEVVKLLDYGLAKFLGADATSGGADLTVTGMVMGTPLYMPPEQAAGARVDVRADVYAVGCIAFEMLTGRLPYVGDDFGELIRAHVTAPVPRLADALPSVEPRAELQALLDKAMAKQAAARFEHAGSMLSALEAIPRPWFRPRGASPRVSGRKRRLATGALAFTLLLLVGIALGVLARRWGIL